MEECLQIAYNDIKRQKRKNGRWHIPLKKAKRKKQMIEVLNPIDDVKKSRTVVGE